MQGFPGLKRELREAARRFPGVPVHHVCVVVADNRNAQSSTAPADRIAWVHWREAEQVDAYLPTRYARIDGASLWGGASFNLRSDVVPDARHIDGSVTRVTRGYANQIVAACKRHGEQLVIERSRD